MHSASFKGEDAFKKKERKLTDVSDFEGQKRDGNLSKGIENFKKRARELWMSPADEDDYSIYAHRDLPKITMETLSSKGFNAILWITYLSFAASITLYFLLSRGSYETIAMNGSGCSLNSSKTVTEYGVAFSCTIDHSNNHTSFIGNISSVVNLIGDIELQVFVPASKISNMTSPSIDLSLHLKGCTSGNIDDCTFMDVLTLSVSSFDLDHLSDIDGHHYYRGILFDTFQNQEALQNNGILSAYQINATYTNGEGLIGSDNVAFYQFHYYSVADSSVVKVIQCILCIFTLIYSVIWYRALSQDEPNPRKWLRERKWLSWFLFGLLLFQNPIYCIAQWETRVTGWTAYLSAIMSFTGQTIIFTLFLLFSDGMAKRTSVWFYFPKLTFTFLMLVMYVCMVSINYPSIYDPERSSILSVMNWPKTLQIRYAIFGSSIVALIICWIFYFIFTIIRSGMRLRKIPYIKARYRHLAYRFFLLQAILVGAVVVFDYTVDIYYLIIYGIRDSSSFSVEHIADDLNSIFNSESQSIAWTLFISVYVYLAVYLYFPISGANLHYFMSRSYVFREGDMETAMEVREKDLNRLKRFGMSIPRFVERKPIFCVERARWMAELSYQAYYDPPDKPIAYEGYRTLGPINVEQFGFEILDFHWDEAHDTNCFILRHQAQKKLVVLFRGSMSREHWADNLKLHLRAIDLHTLCPRGCESDQPAILDENLDQYMEEWESSSSKKFFGRVKDNVQQAGRTGVDFVIDGLETTATAMRLNRVPGLKHGFVGYVHTGFWDAYACVRERVHRSVRRYLLEEEYELFITGHSLGGALASLASMDLTIHTLPKVNAVWATRRGLKPESDFKGKCTITMYNFGSPRVGNRVFRTAYNRLVPHSFRVVVDGDLVSAIPPRFWYQHLGTEVIIDGEGDGGLIIDPSVAEKKFQIRPRSNAIIHHLDYYNKGIRCILSEEMDQQILDDLTRPPDEIVPYSEDQPGFFGPIFAPIRGIFGFNKTTKESETPLDTDEQKPLSEALL